MEAIRKKIKRNGKNKITVELPEDFKAENLELIIFPSEETETDELSTWKSFSISNLEKAYGTDEPDYVNVKVKEPNPKYGG